MPHERTGLTHPDRRTFVRVLSGTAAAGCGAAVLASCRDEPTALEPAFARQTVTPRYPLSIPPVVALATQGLTLSAAPAEADLGDGRLRTVWAYNHQTGASFPGPTLLANRFDHVQITLVNGLPEETITHWHGMLVAHEDDGHPMQVRPPGGTYNYDFTVDQRAALNWYHPHPHMLTGKQVAMGLAGAFIVRDAEEAALGLPGGAYEVPLIVRDASFDRSGDMAYAPKAGGFEGKTPLVNGTLSPYLAVDQGWYRFRVLNGCNARIFRFALSAGSFLLIGNDGGLLPQAVTMADITLAPAERLDLLVNFAGLPAGQTRMLRDLRTGWNLLEFRGTGLAGFSGAPPSSLSSVVPLSSPGLTRVFSFDGMSKINGREYAMDRVDFQVPFGQVERWRFTTNGNAPHPVHVHGASFQIVSRTGGRGMVFPWEGGWKDTVLLEDGETVDILIRFDAFRGLYVMHCHKLEHEDMGMMSNFDVI